VAESMPDGSDVDGSPRTIEFLGKTFPLAGRIGLMPVMRFAKAAKSGLDSLDMEALAVLFDLLEQCIAPEEWVRFQDHADEQRADGDDLLKVVTDTFEVLSARPTRRPSNSSDGPATTAARSTASDFAGVIERMERKGRPDLAVMVTQAQEAMAV
jgi:hypothetical protein